VGDLELANLLERERELAVVDDLIARALAGRGSLLVFEGPAGIGKTQLLSAVRRRAARAGLAQLAARGGVLDSGHSWGVTRTLLAPVVAARVDQGESLHAVSGAATSLFDPEAVPATGRAGEPSFAVLAALCEIVIAWSRRGPLLVTIDDAHWVDPETLRLLASLVSRVQEHPVLLALGVRAREPGSARQLLWTLAADPAATSLRPAALSAAAIGTLLGTELATEPDPAFVAAYERATGGNPFLCSELARTLAADGLAPTAANAGRLSAYAPFGIALAVLARLARLPLAARRAADALAVLGGEAGWNMLEQLAEVERDELAEMVDLLADADIVADAGTPAFRHPIIRTAIYEDIAVSERERAHRRAARLLDTLPGADREDVAAHLLLTRPSGDTWVSERLREAGDRALRQGAAEAASRYLRRAVAEPPAPHQLAATLALLGESETRRGDPAAAAVVFQSALEVTREPTVRAELAIALSLALLRINRPAEAMSLLEETIDRLPAEEHELGRKMETELEVIAHLNGHAGRTVRGRPLRFPRPTSAAPDDHGQRLALAGRADIEMNQGRADDAARLALRALSGGALMRSEGANAVLFFSTAIVLLYCDWLDDAARVYTDALGHARELGLSGLAASAQGFLAGVELRRGRLAEAETLARAALGETTVAEMPMRATFACAFLVDALVERGELGLATRALEQHGADGALPDSLITNILQHARGRLRAATGDHRGALADHLDCGRRAEEWQMQTPAVENWQSLAAIGCRALGRLPEAQSRAAKGTLIARAFGSPRALGTALIVEGSVGGELAPLEEAATVLDGTGDKLTQARALITLGGALRRAGQRARSRDCLTQGLRLARVCGAVPLAREADAELTVLGSRSRRILRSGAAELTAGERRVADLAARGHSNQQIADALVVSIRTVEAHLAHTYQKLDITSRRELVGALGPDAALPAAVERPV
jgi:DNA-binding CsgD family transcriptional regulator